MENEIIVNLIALLFLTAMEIVLGIDNIVFIAILTGRLPKEQQLNARRLGLGAALVMRILLLLTLSWIIHHLASPIFHFSQLGLFVEWLGEREEINDVSWRDIILFAGGLFLIAKSVFEIHEQIEGDPSKHAQKKPVSFGGVLIQIALLDLVFSLDSVITAVGMADSIPVMIAAIVIAVVAMLVFAESVSRFIERTPTLKMLALSFLLLIGVLLVADGVGTPVNKGYIYFAMAFAILVEILNLRVRAKRTTAIGQSK